LVHAARARGPGHTAPFIAWCARKEDQSRSAHSIGDIMAGLDPAIQTTSFRCWMPGSRPGMTIVHDAPPSAVSILEFKAQIRLLRRAMKPLITN
jgi:hypothetical protein